MLIERITASGVGLTIGSIGGSAVRNITFRDGFMADTYKASGGLRMHARTHARTHHTRPHATQARHASTHARHARTEHARTHAHSHSHDQTHKTSTRAHAHKTKTHAAPFFSRRGGPTWGTSTYPGPSPPSPASSALTRRQGIYLKFRDDVGGSISDVTFEDVRIVRPEQWPIWIGPAQQSDSRRLCAPHPCSICWPEDPLAQCYAPAGQVGRWVFGKRALCPPATPSHASCCSRGPVSTP